MRYRVVLYGDVTDDSFVNALDATDVERMANGYGELIEYEFLAADIDCDNAVTLSDYQSVLNVGLSS